jgi:catechol 2,3-dioxygenase-like lactoylglutathione lyase family enzyme
MRIGVVEVFLDEHDQALAFYTDMLGFQVKTEGFEDDRDKALVLDTDVLGFRVTTDAPRRRRRPVADVVAPDDLNGTELLRGRLSQAAETLQAERREAGTPAVSFATDDPPAQPRGAHPAGRGVRVRATTHGLRRHRRRVRGWVRQPAQPSPGLTAGCGC